MCDGVLLTPPLDACGIAGTRRRLILQQLAPACGLEVRETRLTTRQLEQCDEAFYSNSLVGLRPVGRFGERSSWTPTRYARPCSNSTAGRCRDPQGGTAAVGAGAGAGTREG
ncbi:MAG: aminotransferase class IV [Pseudomonadales bacterium]|nr:aminotransferase class IV [Pseudomonadales bacterium]